MWILCVSPQRDIPIFPVESSSCKRKFRSPERSITKEGTKQTVAISSHQLATNAINAKQAATKWSNDAAALVLSSGLESVVVVPSVPVVVVSPPVVFQPSMVVVVVMIEFHGDPVVFIVAPHHRIIVVRGITDHRGIAEQPRNVGRISHVTYSEANKVRCTKLYVYNLCRLSGCRRLWLGGESEQICYVCHMFVVLQNGLIYPCTPTRNQTESFGITQIGC